MKKTSHPAPGATTFSTFSTKLELDVQVPKEDWIDILTEEPRIFYDTCCGHWLRSVEWDTKRGRLVWEDDGKHDPGKEPKRKAAIEAWAKGINEPLPKGWYRLDRRAAIKAFCEGVKLWGLSWMTTDHNDARGYDVVIQMALLGEHRHDP